MKSNVSFATADYLEEKYPCISISSNLWINGACCPDDALAAAIKALPEETSLVKDNIIIASRSKSNKYPDLQSLRQEVYQDEITLIDHLWKIFKSNADEIRMDYDLITANRISEGIRDPHTSVYNEENIFIEEGASIKAAVINAETGPVYIGKNAIINEGAIIKGAFALCEGAQVSMGGKMRGDTTIGPYCRAGGEISNSVLFGYSNKSHDGFLGNSVIGEWCNLGADTNASNLKNNYSEIKIWNYQEEGFTETKEKFCGLMMGDHAKCGINTMFNTGTVIGVASNIFGAGFPRNFIPSFSWGGATGFKTYQLDKAHATMERVMERRGLHYDQTEKEIMTSIFELTAKYRSWEEN